VSGLDDIAVLLLAAGLSRRYGTGDKLLAPLAGKPLALHAAAMLAALPFGRRLAVCKPGDDVLPRRLVALGFAVVTNPEPEAGQGTSLALGAKAAGAAGKAGLLVCLADMPFVSAADIEELVAAWRRDSARPAAAGAGGYLGAPALFPASALPALARLSGDRGARALLADAVPVAVDPAHLRDFDRPEDFG